MKYNLLICASLLAVTACASVGTRQKIDDVYYGNTQVSAEQAQVVQRLNDNDAAPTYKPSQPTLEATPTATQTFEETEVGAITYKAGQEQIAAANNPNQNANKPPAKQIYIDTNGTDPNLHRPPSGNNSVTSEQAECANGADTDGNCIALQ